MVLETGCWLFEMFRAGRGSFLLGAGWEAYMVIAILGNDWAKYQNAI